MRAYRCAIVGCGARGFEQAQALASIPEMELVAGCDPDPRRLERLREAFGVQALYGDLDAMLGRQKPDIAHVMTHPDVRAELVVRCARAGVKAVSMEKPMAQVPSQAEAMRAAAEQTGCLMAVNHQRRYMPHVQTARRELAQGRIGQVKLVRASTHGRTLLEMGPHMIDLVLMMLGEQDPLEVWATSAGAEGFQSDIRHDAPTRSLARILFPGPLEVLFIHSQDTVGAFGPNQLYMHLELDFWGAEGRLWHTQNDGWGYQSHGMAEPVTGHSAWMDDADGAQREFTRALGAWISDPAAGHECDLERSLRGFRILMGIMKSSLTGKPWRWTDEVTDADIRSLRQLCETREQPKGIS